MKLNCLVTARCGDQLLFQIFASPVACGLRGGGGFSSQVVSSKTAENAVSSTTGTESYIDDYLTSPCMTEDTDPLSFRKLNENKYPALAKSFFASLHPH